MGKSKVEQFRDTPPRFSQRKLNEIANDLNKVSMKDTYPKPRSRNMDEFWSFLATIAIIGTVVSGSMWFILAEMVQG